jgi:hypothetical protein
MKVKDGNFYGQASTPYHDQFFIIDRHSADSNDSSSRPLSGSLNFLGISRSMNQWPGQIYR